MNQATISTSLSIRHYPVVCVVVPLHPLSVQFGTNDAGTGGLQWTIRRCIDGLAYAPELDKRSLSRLEPKGFSSGGWDIKVKGEWKYLYQAVVFKGTPWVYVECARGMFGRQNDSSARQWKVYAYNQEPNGQSPVAYGRRSPRGANRGRAINVDKVGNSPAVDELKPIKTTGFRQNKYFKNIVGIDSSNDWSIQARIWKP